MTQRSFDVVGVGNALVDVMARVDDTFITENSLTKGSMRLIDHDEASSLYNKMPPAQETSGGSAANTLAALSSLGGKGGFIAHIGQDELGDVFAHDMRAQGVAFAEGTRDPFLPTGRCLVLVSPDGERTMNTSLACNVNFLPDDLSAMMIQNAKVVYLEGYLFDQPKAKAAYFEAAKLAKASNAEVALTLSDSFCVERHRTDFLSLVRNDIDILFANEAEICTLYETTDFNTAAQAITQDCKIAVLTRGAHGAVVIAENKTCTVPATPVSRVVDLTGAGDAFAAGFLYGYTQGLSYQRAGEIGALASSEVISHFGARPETPLSTLLAA